MLFSSRLNAILNLILHARGIMTKPTTWQTLTQDLTIDYMFELHLANKEKMMKTVLAQPETVEALPTTKQVTVIVYQCVAVKLDPFDVPVDATPQQIAELAGERVDFSDLFDKFSDVAPMSDPSSFHHDLPANVDETYALEDGLCMVSIYEGDARKEDVNDGSEWTFLDMNLKPSDGMWPPALYAEAK